MLDGDEIKKRLKDVPRELCVAFAARCALRALPLLARDVEGKEAFYYWSTQAEQEKHLLAVMRAVGFAFLYGVDRIVFFTTLSSGDNLSLSRSEGVTYEIAPPWPAYAAARLAAFSARSAHSARAADVIYAAAYAAADSAYAANADSHDEMCDYGSSGAYDFEFAYATADASANDSDLASDDLLGFDSIIDDEENAANYGYGRKYTNSAWRSYTAYIDAAAAAAAHTAYDSIYNAAILEDISNISVSTVLTKRLIGSNIYLQKFLQSPLWPKGQASSLSDGVQARFVRGLRDLDAGFEVWIKWYEDRMVGKEIDGRLLKKMLDIPEEVDAQGPKAVNAYIAAQLQGELKPINLVPRPRSS